MLRVGAESVLLYAHVVLSQMEVADVLKQLPTFQTRNPLIAANRESQFRIGLAPRMFFSGQKLSFLAFLNCGTRETFFLFVLAPRFDAAGRTEAGKLRCL